MYSRHMVYRLATSNFLCGYSLLVVTIKASRHTNLRVEVYIIVLSYQQASLIQVVIDSRVQAKHQHY